MRADGVCVYPALPRCGTDERYGVPPTVPEFRADYASSRECWRKRFDNLPCLDRLLLGGSALRCMRRRLAPPVGMKEPRLTRRSLLFALASNALPLPSIAQAPRERTLVFTPRTDLG